MVRLFLSLGAVMLLAVCAVQAQERTAGSALDTQVNWSALKMQIDTLTNQNKALETTILKFQACAVDKKIFSPTAADKDANGCVSVGGGSNVQTGVWINPTSYTALPSQRVNFPRAFSKVPTVVVMPNEFYYRDGCRADEVFMKAAVVSVDKTGFNMYVGGWTNGCNNNTVPQVSWVATEAS